ncbi:MAG: hypothetical protein K1X75_17630 [Leptospirales bacterium]|nr:hypothetical protein [Leptospirales bacterium]
MSTKSSELACDLTALTEQERKAHLAKAAHLRGSLIGLQEVDGGTEFYFPAGMDISALREFARQEQRCCSWIEEIFVREEAQRSVMILRATPEGRAAWISAFMANTSAQTPQPSTGPGWKQMLVAAGAMCLACLFPLVGGILVARGLLPAAWNAGEGTYMAVAAGVIALYFGRSWWKSRSANRGDSKDESCAC